MKREQLKTMRKAELIDQLVHVGDDNLKFKRINTKLQTDIKELKRKNGIANNKIAKIRLESGESPWLDILGYCILVVKNTPGYKKQLDKILESIK